MPAREAISVAGWICLRAGGDRLKANIGLQQSGIDRVLRSPLPGRARGEIGKETIRLDAEIEKANSRTL
jgi:hypothetical protein